MSPEPPMRILLLTQCYQPEVAAAAVRARGAGTIVLQEIHKVFRLHTLRFQFVLLHL